VWKQNPDVSATAKPWSLSNNLSQVSCGQISTTSCLCVDCQYTYSITYLEDLEAEA